MMKISRFDPGNLKHFSAYEGRYTCWEDMKIDNPHCVAAFDEKRPGGDTSEPWLFWNDEVWYMIEGELKVEWSDPPMFNEWASAVLSPGDLAWVPAGLRVKSTVLGDKPVRLLWVSMPRPRHFGGEDFFEDESAG